MTSSSKKSKTSKSEPKIKTKIGRGYNPNLVNYKESEYHYGSDFEESEPEYMDEADEKESESSDDDDSRGFDEESDELDVESEADLEWNEDQNAR